MNLRTASLATVLLAAAISLLPASANAQWRGGWGWGGFGVGLAAGAIIGGAPYYSYGYAPGYSYGYAPSYSYGYAPGYNYGYAPAYSYGLRTGLQLRLRPWHLCLCSELGIQAVVLPLMGANALTAWRSSEPVRIA